MTSIFETNFLLLVKTCRDILSIMPIEGIITKYLNNYERSYSSGKVPLIDHIPFVRKTYDQFREFIVGPDFSWVTNESVMIVFNVSPNMRIMFSAFFRHATRLCERTEKELVGQPDTAYENRKELIYPDVLLLHLYRMFAVVCPESDVQKVMKNVKKLEDELGIAADTNPDTKPDPMASVMTTATKMMKQMGMPVPDKLPASGDFGNIFEKLMSNPELQSTMQGMMASLQGGDLPSAMGNIMGQFQSGKFDNLVKSIQETVPEMATVVAQTGSGGGGAVSGPKVSIEDIEDVPTEHSLVEKSESPESIPSEPVPEQ